MAERLESDLFLNVDHPDFGRSGLRVASTLRLHRMLTVSRAVVRRELGELSPALQAEVAARLRTLFCL